jgi:LmbE family N-acetylglucosaminyl deacetylase
MKNYLKFVFIKICIFFINRFCKSFSNQNIGDSSRNSILVIAPHPDDEIIGLGGFIIKALKAKKKVSVLFLTDGESSGAFHNTERIKAERINITNQVLSELSIPVENIFRMHLSDGSVPREGDGNYAETSERITQLIEKIKPDFVFATHYHDYWPYDHLACFELTREAVQKSKHNTELWLYWVWTWYNLNLSRLIRSFKVSKIDIAAEFAQKNRLMDMYLNPLSPEGKPWSGKLPDMMLYPFQTKFEIVEKYKI